MSTPEHKKVEHRLWDTQWMNVVNHPDVLGAATAEEAVAIAVKMTEERMARNIADGHWPPARERTPA